jgi:site-specific DNA-methyltransferase (cytosine-N4-specific)
VRRVRVKDAVNCIWWLSPTPWPKANNRRILQPYSESMIGLLKNGYTPKLRPSGHDISDKFGRDNKGSIPPNLLALANTESNGVYQKYCQERGLPRHPARFPAGIPEQFIRMLSDPDDLVVDPFAGSCVTGEVAQRLGRRWLCCEIDPQYLEGARSRFQRDAAPANGNGNGHRPNGSQVASERLPKPYSIYPPVSLPSRDDRRLALDGGRRRA